MPSFSLLFLASASTASTSISVGLSGSLSDSSCVGSTDCFSGKAPDAGADVAAEFCTCGEMTALLCVMDTGAAVDAATAATVTVDTCVAVAFVVAAEDSEGDVVVVTVSGAGVGSVEAATGVLTVFSAAVTGVEEVEVCTLEGAAATGGGILPASGCGDEAAAADVVGDEEEVADVDEDLTDSVDV